MKRIIIFCSFFLALNAAAYCGQASRIELTDGSVINGEIVSYLNGVYTVQTATFGEIKIETAKVSKIISPTTQINNSTQSQIDTYKQKIMNNPENTAIITGLATDSQIQGLAKDPEIVNAAKAGDIQALMKNKKFMDIVNNPKIQETIKKLKQ